MTARAIDVDVLPHKPPMRLVEEIVDLIAGVSARGLRRTRQEDWYFQGHFPDDPVVPAVVLIELLAQTGGVAVASDGRLSSVARLRVAAVGPFKFPASAHPNQQLDARTRVVGRIGGMFKVEGEVLADGILVALGSLTLAVAGASASPSGLESERMEP